MDQRTFRGLRALGRDTWSAHVFLLTCIQRFFCLGNTFELVSTTGVCIFDTFLRVSCVHILYVNVVLQSLCCKTYTFTPIDITIKIIDLLYSLLNRPLNSHTYDAGRCAGLLRSWASHRL